MDFGPLKDLAMYNPTDEDLKKTVDDFVTLLGCWNWDVIHAALLEHICLKLATILPSSASASQDCISWNLSKDGQFSVKSTYALVERPYYNIQLLI